MAYTLAQLAKLETDDMRKGIIENIIRDAKIMELLPWEKVSSLTNVALRWRVLPDGGAFRKIGGSYTESTDGQVEQVWESVYAFGGEIKFDKVFDLVTNTIIDPKVQQLQMRLKSFALTFNDYFINGDHSTEPDGFEGLKKRVSLMPTRQTLTMGSGSATALIPTGSIANARYLLDKIEEGMYKCNGGQVGAICVNERMYYGLGRVLRYVQASAGNIMDVTKDSFGRQVLTWAGVPLVDMGLKKDQSTEIITNTETADDSGSDATSMYFLSLGSDGLTGIQLNEFKAYDINGGQELETAPATAMRIDWICGLAGFNSHHIVRAKNISDPALWT